MDAPERVKRDVDLGPAPTELQIQIDCRNRRAEHVLEDLVRGLALAETQGLDPLVVLQNLGLLGDSVTTLIKGISRRLVGYPRTVTFWEASGYTEAFLSAMESLDSQGPPEKAPSDG